MILKSTGLPVQSINTGSFEAKHQLIGNLGVLVKDIVTLRPSEAVVVLLGVVITDCHFVENVNFLCLIINWQIKLLV